MKMKTGSGRSRLSAQMKIVLIAFPLALTFASACVPIANGFNASVDGYGILQP